jgi:hypothetical protein
LRHYHRRVHRHHRRHAPAPPPAPKIIPGPRPIITLPPEQKTEVVNIPVNSALQAQTKNDLAQRSKLQTTNADGRKHLIDRLKTQYAAAEAAYRAATPKVLSKLTGSLKQIHARNTKTAANHRLARVTREQGVKYGNLRTQLQLARKRLAHARRSSSGWKRRVRSMAANRKQLRASYRKLNYDALKRAQAAELAMDKFDQEMASVRRAAKRLAAEKRKLRASSVKEAYQVVNKEQLELQKANGFDPATGRYTPRFQPEADGSHAKTRTLIDGKLIDPSSHAQGLIEDDYAADWASISGADLVARNARETHREVRDSVAEIVEAATYDISPSRAVADVADSADWSFLEAGAERHHHRHHRRRHYRRHRSSRAAPAPTPAAAQAGPPGPPIYVKSAPIITRITNDPNLAIQKTAAAAASTFSSSESRMDAAFQRARKDVLRVHQRNMAQLRADRAKQVKALKTQWRKKALKYNHHPEPTKKKYGSAHLKKVKAQIRKINAKAKALERTAAKYKTKYERTAKTFDESRVRNDGDSKEQNSKIGTLMKKLARANRETATVSKILDKFD